MIERARPVLDASLALARRKPVQRLIAVVLLVFSVAAIGLLVSANWEQLTAAEWHFDPLLLLVGVLLQASTALVGLLLWADVSAQLGAGWHLRRDARVYAYSMLAKRLPGAVWHAVGRAAYYGEVGLGRRVGLMGSLLEAGLLVVTGTAVWLGAFAAIRPIQGVDALAAIQPFGLVAAVAALLLWPIAFRPLARLALRSDLEWLPPLPRLYLWTGADVAAWLLGGAGVYFQFLALYPLPVDALATVIWATSGSIVASALVVVLPGGLGLRELGMTGLLTVNDFIPVGVAAALAVAFRISIATIEVLFALAVLVVVPAPKAGTVGA